MSKADDRQLLHGDSRDTARIWNDTDNAAAEQAETEPSA